MITKNLSQTILYSLLDSNFKKNSFVSELMMLYYGIKLSDKSGSGFKDIFLKLKSDRKELKQINVFNDFLALKKISITIEQSKNYKEIALLFDLSSERVRQLVKYGVYELNKSILIFSSYHINRQIFSGVLDKSDYISINKLLIKNFYSEFLFNKKGLVNIFSHSGIGYLKINKVYYFFDAKNNKEIVLNKIETDNKRDKIRFSKKNRNSTMSMITYAPYYIKDILKLESFEYSSMRNFYSNIINDFLLEKPYNKEADFFNKDKDWCVPKGKKVWCQIYIVFPKNLAEQIKKHAKKQNTSNMHFIACGLTWHALKDKQLEKLRKY